MKQTFAVVIALFLAPLMHAQTDIKISAPVTTDLAGKTGQDALVSVIRVIVPTANSAGTGFLHKSGVVITAAHVIGKATADKIYLVLPSNIVVMVDSTVSDEDIDLAILRPKTEIKVKALPLSAKASLPVGSQVSTWGFPEGYSGLNPLLTVGYVSGLETVKISPTKSVNRFVVNAAFNRGNSGGPVLDLETGAVIGVVSSKHAPIPPEIMGALEALGNNPSGVQYTGRRQDGTEVSFSEGQVVASVLQYLRAQTQLVIGYSVTTEDLFDFLKKNKIEP